MKWNQSKSPLKVNARFQCICACIYVFYVIDNNTFNVGDVLLKYLSKEQIDSDVQTGRCRTIKMPVEMAEFKSLPDALTKPAFFDWDFSKAEKTPQFHLLWQALYSFEKKVIDS